MSIEAAGERDAAASGTEPPPPHGDGSSSDGASGSTELDEPIPIGLVLHYAFCPRRAWLEAVGEHTDTWQMAVGTARHAPTDDPDTGRRTIRRAVDVWHDQWGLTGRCDTLEVEPDGAVRIVEYKATPVRQSTEVTWPMRLQVALQRACLTSMGYRVEGQDIWFTEHRRRIPVEITDEDMSRAHAAAIATRRIITAKVAPEPLEDDRRCSRCSHLEVCLPDERQLKPVKRRVKVSDPDAQVVHLATPGSRASIRTGRIVVEQNHETLLSVPMERVQGVVVDGNVDVSGALLRELLWRNLSVVWCTSGGRVVGWASSTNSPNGDARVEQHVQSRKGRLDLAREFVGAKIHNQATFLRRNGKAEDAVAELRRQERAAAEAHSIPELLGIEGDSASRYFAAFGTMLHSDVADFRGRTRRPARDPVNSALNYSYALLLGDCIRAIRSCGLDPHAGFLHTSVRNKPALALDLCEEFRSVVADSAVVRAFNNGELDASSFREQGFGGVWLTTPGRRALIRAYEQRVEVAFVHPVFEYKVSWRRAMEVQARQVLGVLDGTQRRYVGVRVR